MERTRQDRGVYRLPRVIEARLAEACRGLRNAEAVMRLAVFLARYHTAPGRLGRTFPIDRVALAMHRDLDLSEAQIRGALAVLEEEGFITREPMPGSPYRRTEFGLRRRAVQWQIGATFAALFAAVNKAVLARRAKAERRLLTRKQTPATAVVSGEQVLSPLEQALARWGKAIGDRRAT